MKTITIGTRGSVLALWQANFIKDELANLGVCAELKIIKTTGDKILDAPLSKIGGKGLFTKELEEKLLNGDIDLAVHSLKDVPVILPSGLQLVAITKREDVRDCFLSDRFAEIESLPQGAKVGTTSLRRAMQIKAIRADLETLSLRGNVQTRLNKLKSGEFDAIILAKAGVNRLDIATNEVRFIVPFEVSAMIPAMGQGALGLECRENDEIADILAKLNHTPTRIECEAEREFVRLCNGGCQVPIGVNAKLSGESLEIHAILGLPNGTKILRESIFDSHELDATSSIQNAKALAQKLFAICEQKGAKPLLDEALAMIEDYFG
ncbi:hydroxymethylbilane synthase [Helicobacter sp. 23-1044]